jgi:hypothetical protein
MMRLARRDRRMQDIGTGGSLTHLCRLQQFYWHMYKMPSPPLITVPGSQTMPLRAL